MLCACIDIGTNTTRVLVAEAEAGRLTEVLQHRAFTRIGRGLDAGGAISAEKIAEVAGVVADQCALAERAGAGHLRVVATAAIRGAANRDELLATIRARAGVEVAVLDGQQEARLAFLGATRTLGRPIAGPVAVVDVGGGSTEIAAGTMEAGVSWARSFPVGSGVLTERHLRADPPREDELEAMRAHARAALDAVATPRVDCAVAVGGSAASLRRLVGAVLEPTTIARALGVLTGATAEGVARRFELDPVRVRLLPAGILVLDAAAHALGQPLLIGRGGLREGVLLDLAAATPST